MRCKVVEKVSAASDYSFTFRDMVACGIFTGGYRAGMKTAMLTSFFPLRESELHRTPWVEWPGGGAYSPGLEALQE